MVKVWLTGGYVGFGGWVYSVFGDDVVERVDVLSSCGVVFDAKVDDDCIWFESANGMDVKKDVLILHCFGPICTVPVNK